MAEDKKEDVASLPFIQDPTNYNNYNNIDNYSVNEALTMDSEGKIQYRENAFNKDLAYSNNILNFRNENSSGFYERTETKKGYVTTEKGFKYNGGSLNNTPVEQDDNVDSKNRLEGIYKVGDLNVNSLRSLHDKNQQA